MVAQDSFVVDVATTLNLALALSQETIVALGSVSESMQSPTAAFEALSPSLPPDESAPALADEPPAAESEESPESL